MYRKSHTKVQICNDSQLYFLTCFYVKPEYGQLRLQQAALFIVWVENGVVLVEFVVRQQPISYP